MIDKNTFCSSPWLHFRINYAGDFVVCRWGVNPGVDRQSTHNIRDTRISDYFNSSILSEMRNQLLTGEKPAACQNCYYQDKFNKISGRKKQLFRSKLDNSDTFDDNFTSSPHYDRFLFSQNNNGLANCLPFDFQIDLENTCNGACIMCSPKASTKLATDYIKLNKIEPEIFAAPRKFDCWASDPVLVKKFVDELVKMPDIDYIHLLGGETLYVESFYTICEALIDAGISKNIIIGTTTNGTVYSPRLEKIITQFRGFHLGLSIESINIINDYIRYPARINPVLEIFDKFFELRNKAPNLHLTLRITPNIFSIFYLDEVIQYMVDKRITAESCNILKNPSILRMELLPADLKEVAVNKLKNVISKNNLHHNEPVIDTRNPNLINEVISNVVYQYIDFLTNMAEPEDVENERHNLVKFLNAFESLRRNSILDYAPEFTTFLEQYGYVKK